MKTLIIISCIIALQGCAVMKDPCDEITDQYQRITCKQQAEEKRRQMAFIMLQQLQRPAAPVAVPSPMIQPNLQAPIIQSQPLAPPPSKVTRCRFIGNVWTCRESSL